MDRTTARRVTDVARETPLSALLLPVTPAGAFFVRDHAREVPCLAPDAYRLEVDGTNGTVVLRLDDLRALPRVSETITLSCAGNARSAFEPVTTGVPWGFGAVSTARWGGVRLRDVLAVAGVPDGARHAIVEGYDPAPDGEKPSYRRSLPLDRAFAEATLVADTMNGEPLPAEHGGPARLIVAGWTANHSLKWLRRIAFGDRPDASFWTAVDYRLRTADGGSAPIETPAPLAILACPEQGDLCERAVTLRGVAYGAPAPCTVRIEIDGAHAGDAAVRYDDGPHAWGRWSLAVAFTTGSHRIAARPVVDPRARLPAPAWNAKGYCYSGPHAVDVEVL